MTSFGCSRPPDRDQSKVAGLVESAGIDAIVADQPHRYDAGRYLVGGISLAEGFELALRRYLGIEPLAGSTLTESAEAKRVRIATAARSGRAR